MNYIAYIVENGKRVMKNHFIFVTTAMLYQVNHPEETVVPFSEWVQLR